jgi:ubiquinone/menaquinone biosynthesis C-methylase UbiE
MSQVVFDERAAQQLEVMYRSRDVVRRRALVREALGARVGDRVLDIGCGPGFASAELLAEVGPTGAVIGVDTSEAMLAAARRRCTGLGNARFYAASATQLPLDDRSFDRALCVQVLEFVPEVSLALAELYRVMRPGGRAVVWDVDWSTLSWHSAEPARMQRMLQAWDRHLAHPALPRLLTAALHQAGFTDVQSAGYAFTTTALDPETYGGFALGVVERYLAGLPDLDRTEVKAWADEQRALDTSGQYYYAVLQVCFTATRPS